MSTALLHGMSRLETRNMGLIILGHALTHWYPATFYMLLPLIGSEMGLSYSQIGFIMTCQYAAGAISNVPGGMLVDVWGKKGQLMALSLFWVGFPYLLMGFTTEYWMLLLCVMLVGIGNNLWHPTAIPLLGRMFPERKGFVLSLHGMGGNVGDALAPLAVGVLLTTLSWREIVVLNVVPGAAMSVLLLFFLYLGVIALANAFDSRERSERAAALIPRLVFTASLVSELGSGMTVRGWGAM
jgi:MFS family permease